MSTESGTTRWWEYYLPRYLMPSVAGVAIVNWLCSYGGDGLRSLLSLPPNGKPLDSSSLILLILYGNLFCYIASYPVLVFHATRVMDFSKGRWPAHPFSDGYILTVTLVVATFFFHLVLAEYRYLCAFVAAFVIAAIQSRRLWIVLSHRFHPKHHGDVVSPVYFYSYVLAHRRGLPAVKETEEKGIAKEALEAESEDLPDEDDEEKEEVKTTRSRTNLWRQGIYGYLSSSEGARKLCIHFSP